MPPKARTSDKSASCAPSQYQILSRPSSSSGTLIVPSLPDVSEFKVSRNTPTMAPSVMRPQAMPFTPPRPKSMQSLPPHGLYQRASPFTEKKLKGPATQSHGHTKATLSPPLPRTLSDTPGRRPKSQTPSKSSGTPSQAYAGPLFHASPAASALPIPKWFSKTTNERKELLEDNALETAAEKVLSEQSDESPTLRKSRMDAEKFPDEPPPKYHIPTDQAEKGKRREGNAIPTSMNEESVISPALSASTLVASSASPDTDGSHPRHPISHSGKELFPLETKDTSDSSVPKQGGHLQRNLSESARPSTAPSHCSAQTMEDEEQRKARSLALKKLLQMPVPQRPVSPPSHLRIAASKNGSRPFPPARNLSGPSTSTASRATKLPYIPRHSCLPSLSPHNVTQEQLQIAQQSHKTNTQHFSTHHTPDTFNKPKADRDFDEYGMVGSRNENRPLPYGKRATLVKESHSRGSSFKSRPPTSSQFSRDLDSASSTNDDRAKQSEDHVQHDGSTCSCKFPISPQQSSSNVERATLQDDSRSNQIKHSLSSGSSFKPRPAISSPQSYPGPESTSVEQYDPKKWLDNHLRHDILKIGTLVNDSATGVAT